jgi:hypothetical protein
MLYLLAAIGAIAVAVLLWRAFVARPATVAPRRPRSLAPDDDPEFLRRLNEKKTKPLDETKKKRPEDEDKPPA